MPPGSHHSVSNCSIFVASHLDTTRALERMEGVEGTKHILCYLGTPMCDSLEARNPRTTDMTCAKPCHCGPTIGNTMSIALSGSYGNTTTRVNIYHLLHTRRRTVHIARSKNYIFSLVSRMFGSYLITVSVAARHQSTLVSSNTDTD
jgi:hypothetical protein